MKASDEGGVVLLLEDDRLVADVVNDMLDDLGYRVVHARQAEEAQVRLGQARFILALVDIGLPGAVDGLAFARRLKETHPTLPILLMTALEMHISAVALEFTMLVKPFGQEALGRLINMLLKTTACATAPPAESAPAPPLQPGSWNADRDTRAGSAD